MTLVIDRPAVTRPEHTITRRAAQLLDSGLTTLMAILTSAGVEFDVEPHRGDRVVTVYRADDTVLVVTGYGVDSYDVTRYDLPEWQDLYGDPTHGAFGLTRWAAALVLMDVRTLPAVA